MATSNQLVEIGDNMEPSSDPNLNTTARPDHPVISVVIPLYNEEESVPHLHDGSDRSAGWLRRALRDRHRR